MLMLMRSSKINNNENINKVEEENSLITDNTTMEIDSIKLTINNHVLTVKLEDNSATKELVKKLSE